MERKRLIKGLLSILDYATLQEIRSLTVYARAYIFGAQKEGTK